MRSQYEEPSKSILTIFIKTGGSRFRFPVFCPRFRVFPLLKERDFAAIVLCNKSCSQVFGYYFQDSVSDRSSGYNCGMTCLQKSHSGAWFLQVNHPTITHQFSNSFWTPPIPLQIRDLWRGRFPCEDLPRQSECESSCQQAYNLESKSSSIPKYHILYVMYHLHAYHRSPC